MNAANDNGLYLTAEELCQRYRGQISVRTLANWRCLGIGPKFVKIGGRCLYPINEVLSWETGRTYSSTQGYGSKTG